MYNATAIVRLTLMMLITLRVIKRLLKEQKLRHGLSKQCS